MSIENVGSWNPKDRTFTILGFEHAPFKVVNFQKKVIDHETFYLAEYEFVDKAKQLNERNPDFLRGFNSLIAWLADWVIDAFEGDLTKLTTYGVSLK